MGSTVVGRVTAASPATDARWLDALHRLVGRVSHELKGALNGVSVNLEVTRSRAAKAEAMASAVAPFANAASDQLDIVIALTDALLGLTRPAREPVDIAGEARRIATLLSAVAKADGKELTIENPSALSALGVTTAGGSAVRLALCESMLAAVVAGTNVRCTATSDASAATIRFESESGVHPSVDAETVAAAGDAGIHIQAEHSAISISFPR